MACFLPGCPTSLTSLPPNLHTFDNPFTICCLNPWSNHFNCWTISWGILWLTACQCLSFMWGLKLRDHHFTGVGFPLYTPHTVLRLCECLHSRTLLYQAGVMCVKLARKGVTETFYDMGSMSQFGHLVMKSIYLSRSNSHEGRPSLSPVPDRPGWLFLHQCMPYAVLSSFPPAAAWWCVPKFNLNNFNFGPSCKYGISWKCLTFIVL